MPERPSDKSKFVTDTLGEPLDVLRHDTPDRHVFGEALLIPDDADVQPTGTVAFAGLSPKVARADHVHPGGGGTGGVTDHGALTGLGDDDHPQYLLPTEVVAGAGITATPSSGTVTVVNSDPGSTAVANHVAAADPHAAYLRPAEVIAGTGISVTTPGDGTVHIIATPTQIGQWRWQAAAFTTDPGSGNVAGNQATATSSTVIVINKTTNDGIGAVWLTQLRNGDPFVINDTTGPQMRFTVTGTPTDNGAWVSIPVSNRTDITGQAEPNNNAVVNVIGNAGSSAPLAHSSLTGLTADDHTQYLKDVDVIAGSNVTVTRPGDSTVVINATGTGGVTAHSALTGLGAPADDHPQYHNDTRGDARYPPRARLISTTAPLQGGGDLTADRTLSVDLFTPTVKGVVPAPGTASTRYLRDDGTWAGGLYRSGYTRTGDAPSTNPNDQVFNFGGVLPRNMICIVTASMECGFASAGFTITGNFLYTNQHAYTHAGAKSSNYQQGLNVAVGGAVWYQCGFATIAWYVPAGSQPQVISRVAFTGGGAGVYQTIDFFYRIYDLI